MPLSSLNHLVSHFTIHNLNTLNIEHLPYIVLCSMQSMAVRLIQFTQTICGNLIIIFITITIYLIVIIFSWIESKEMRTIRVDCVVSSEGLLINSASRIFVDFTDKFALFNAHPFRPLKRRTAVAFSVPCDLSPSSKNIQMNR